MKRYQIAAKAYLRLSRLTSSCRCFRCGDLLDSLGDGICRDCSYGLDYIVGDRCRLCGVQLISELDVCLRCRDVDWGFDSVRGVFTYTGAAGELVRLYKLQNHPRLARFFAGYLSPLLAEVPNDVPLVPVPPRPERLREYGWDQVARLTGALKEQTGRPIANVLRRTGGLSQKSLNLEGRRENLVGKIILRGDVRHSRCILVDDVMTTGATLSVCATVLKAGGFRSVDAVVIAVD